MNGRRAIVGLCMLCALLVSAFASQSASAITGTTAFTCVKDVPGATLRGEHCLTSGSAEPKWGEVVVAQNQTTDILATNVKTGAETTTAQVARLKVTIAGVPLELSATGVNGSGSMVNKVAASGEHYTHGLGTITYTGVEVTAPAGRGCKVYTDNEAAKTEGEVGVVHTRELTATTEGQGDFVKFQPVDGPEKSFANFFVTCEEGKKIPAIEGTWECLGSVKGVPNGATIGFTHTATTEQNTLKCKGTKSGIEGQATKKGRVAGSGESFTPLISTTVTT